MQKTQDELKTKILSVLQNPTMTSFATVKDGKPWVRYVMLHTKDNLDMYFTTSKKSRKIAQINQNPNCHITAGGSPTDFTNPYLQIEGKAEILEDPSIKKEFWSDYLGKLFTGPEDPDYVIVHIKPEIIECWNPDHSNEIYKVS
ncbi:MAG: pyridoxamine 5'-phosphate oxidase family protein [Armatimonadota bacterium]